MKTILFPFRFENLKAVINEPEKNPKEFMYGSYELTQKYDNIDFFLEPRGQRNTLLKKILFYFEYPFSRIVKLGMPHEVYLCNRKKFNKVEKVLCINDAISFAVLFWKMIGCIKADVYTLFQSLPERRIKYFQDSKHIIRFISKLLSYARVIMVLSSAAKHELAKQFNVPLEKIEVFYFGVDLSFWQYKPFSMKDRDYILTVGNDMNRDYDIIVQALAKNYKVIAVTRKDVGDSITVKTGISNHELMQLYHGARIVLTPSVKLLTESSGLSTTVQAMACGTPVLVSDSPPMRELFQESKHIFYYEPQNPNSLAEIAKKIWNNEILLSKLSVNARRLVESKLNSENMALQLERYLEIA